MASRRSRLLSRALAAVMVGWLSMASAQQPSASDRETARGLIDEGDTRAAAGDHSAALRAYQGAYAIIRVPTTGIAVARTLAALGQFVEAKRVADEVVAMPARVDEPPVLAVARQQAADLSMRVGPRIASVSVQLRPPQPAGAVLLVDGKEAKVADFLSGGSLDPGRHRLEVRTASMRGQASVQLGDGENKTVLIELVPTQTAVEAPPSRDRTVGYVLGGVGLAGLTTAAVTGVVLLSRDSRISDNCPDKHCNAEGRDLIDTSKSLLVVNAIAWGVGLVASGAGAYFLFASDGSKSASSTSTAIAPSVSRSGIGVSLHRRF